MSSSYDKPPSSYDRPPSSYDKPPPSYDKPPPYQEQPGYGPPPPAAVPPQPYNVLPMAQSLPPGQPPYGYQHGAPPVVVHTIPGPQVVLVGGCPACRVGVLEDDFTCLGICLAIVFFPLGLICLLALRERRCHNCGATFG